MPSHNLFHPHLHFGNKTSINNSNATSLSIDKIESSLKKEDKKKITSTKSVSSKIIQKIPLLLSFPCTSKLLCHIQVYFGLTSLRKPISPIFLIIIVRYVPITRLTKKRRSNSSVGIVSYSLANISKLSSALQELVDLHFKTPYVKSTRTKT